MGSAAKPDLPILVHFMCKGTTNNYYWQEIAQTLEVLTGFSWPSCYIFQDRLFGLNIGGARSMPSMQFKLLGWLESKPIEVYVCAIRHF